MTVWNTLQVIATLILSGSFLASGVAKLREPASTGDTFVALGIPILFRREWITRSYPVAEIALGLGLVVLPAPLWWLGAATAAILLAILTTLVARVVIVGDAVSCNCFGSTQPVTIRTIVRNGILLALAVIAVVSAPSMSSLMTTASNLGFDVLFAIVAAGLATAGVIVLIMAGPGRVRGSVTHKNEMLAIPDATVFEADGRSVPLPSLTAGGAVLLVHVKTGCGPCAEVIERMPDGSLVAGRVRVRLVERMPVSSHPHPTGRLWDERGEVAALLGMQATPAALLLAADGTIPADPVRGAPAIFELADAVEAAVRAQGGAPLDDVDL